MNRRDFLLFRTEARTRIAELSCERLYMRFLDLQLTGRDNADTATEGESERPPVFGERSIDQLLDRLRHDLREADVVRLADREWLAQEEFHRALEPVLHEFQARGGIVQH